MRKDNLHISFTTPNKGVDSEIEQLGQIAWPMKKKIKTQFVLGWCSVIDCLFDLQNQGKHRWEKMKIELKKKNFKNYLIFEDMLRVIDKLSRSNLFQRTKLLSYFPMKNLEGISVLNADIERSANDKAEYKIIKINKNDLKCLLISDAEADQSVCSMHVAVGSLEDPIEYQGLAHFCEHMLFLGTEKYPIESEYKAFLSQHAGTQNASTGPLSTVYHFSCANGEAYESALDRFSQFFITPSFTESCTSREMKAVDSENKKNFSSDSRRIYQIHRQTAKSDNVYNKFGTGNLSTLDKPGVREALINFYKTNYSSNRMSLVLYSNETHNVLQELAQKYFENISNLNLPQIVYNSHPYGQKELSKYIKMIPVGESHLLKLQWQVDYQFPFYQSKPVEYLTHLLGHEGENSLLSLLIDENLAFELSSGVNDNMRLYSEIGVDITLTPLGQSNLDKVYNIVGEYIKLIQNTPIQKWIWDEMKSMKMMNFEFKEKSNPVTQSILLCKKLYEYPPEDILSSAYKMEIFDEEQIKKYLGQLTLENMRIANLSKTLINETKLKEPIYGTSYSFDDIPEDVCKCFTHPNLSFLKSTKKLGLPLQNAFIPKSLQLITPKTEYLADPIIVYENEATRVWLKQDDKFKTPKGEAQLIMYWVSGQDLTLAQSQVLVSLLLQLFKDKIRELQYLAKLANVVDSRSASTTYLKYTVGGFSYSIVEYTKQFAEEFKFLISSEPWNEQQFQEKLLTFIQRKEIALKNSFKQEPYHQVDKYLSSLLDYQVANQESQLQFLRDTAFSEILLLYKKFHKSLLTHIRFEWSFIGNFEKESSIELALAIQEIFMNKPSNNLPTQILRKDQVEFGRTVQLENDKVIIFNRECEKDQVNSACLTAFQFYDKQIESRGIISKNALFSVHNKFKILHNFLKSPVYSQLRTTEQLGYIVSTSYKKFNKIPHFSFLVQSSIKSPQYLSSRITSCIQNLKQTLVDLPEEEFSKFVSSVRNQYQRKHLNIYEQARYFNAIIEDHGDHFDLLQRYIDDLDHIKKQDIIELFDTLFNKQRRLIELHLISPKHKEEQEKLILERIQNGQEKIKLIDTFYHTQNHLKLYPSFISFN